MNITHKTVSLSNTTFFIVSHLFRFGGKPAGLLYGTKQGEGAVTADGGRSERLPTWLSCSGKKKSQETKQQGLWESTNAILNPNHLSFEYQK